MGEGPEAEASALKRSPTPPVAGFVPGARERSTATTGDGGGRLATSTSIHSEGAVVAEDVVVAEGAEAEVPALKGIPFPRSVQRSNSYQVVLVRVRRVTWGTAGRIPCTPSFVLSR